MMMKTPIAAAAAATAACKVWTRLRFNTVPCVFGRSVFESLRTTTNNNNTDSSITSEQQQYLAKAVVVSPSTASPQRLPSYHCDRMIVDLEVNEDDNNSVVLTTPLASNEAGRKAPPTTTTATTGTNNDKSKNPKRHGGIPLGRAIDCPTLKPRALEDDRFDRRRRPFASLAVVGMVVVTDDEDIDSDNDTNNDDADDSSCGDNSDTNASLSSSPFRLLITRRPSYMRSFPGAFVFPGGNVDADDESLEHALSREIFEETGLVVSEDSWKLECLWESIYPTQLPPPLDVEEEGEETATATATATATTTSSSTGNINEDNAVVQPQDGAIKAHHLVCYFSGRPQTQTQQQSKSKSKSKSKSNGARLNLCEEEVDGAVWMSRNNIRDLLEATAHIESNNKNEDGCGLLEIGTNDQTTIALHTTSTNASASSSNNATNNHGGGKNDTILLSDLAGIYPRLDETSDRCCGMAQGTLFALEEFTRKQTEARDTSQYNM